MTIMIRMMLNLYQGEAEIPQSAVTSFATARSVRRTASEVVMVDGCWMYVETSTKRSDTELQVPSWDNLVDEFDAVMTMNLLLLMRRKRRCIILFVQ